MGIYYSIIKKVNDTTLFEKYNLYFAGDSFSGPRIESALSDYQ